MDRKKVFCSPSERRQETEAVSHQPRNDEMGEKISLALFRRRRQVAFDCVLGDPANRASQMVAPRQ